MTKLPSKLDASTPPSWPRWQRVGFRYLCLHWLLYAFTDPQGNPLLSLLGVIRFWLAKVAAWGKQVDWFDVDLTGWTGWLSGHLVWLQGSTLDMNDGQPGEKQGWCLRFTSWLSDMSAHLNGGEQMFVVHHQPTGSGDTMHDFVKLCAIMVVAGLLTVVWSLLDRSRAYPRLGRWLHLGARWYVALQLFGYGLAKFGTLSQFPEPSIAGLTREVGDHSPMGLVWTFMGANTSYKYFSGAGELLGFLLLLHRRTALLGCFVAIGVMANVCALNWLCGVPVKLYSTHLLLIPVFLLAPFAPRLWALFVSNRFSESVEIRVARSRWLAWPLLALGVLWFVGLIWQGIEGKIAMAESPRIVKMTAKPELFGLWTVEKMLLDGVEVPLSDATRWQSLAIDVGNSASAKTLMGQVHGFVIEEDLAANKVTLKPRSVEDAESMEWTIERSVVTRKVRNPNPKALAERGGQIDGEVDAIVFKGSWNGSAIELHTVKKIFRVHDGFRLIREFPR